MGEKADTSLGSCLDTQDGATVVTGMDLANCKRGNTGAAGIELGGPRPGTGDASGRIVIGGNTFCRFQSAVPSAMAGVLIGENVDSATIYGNVFSGCTAPALVNRSAGPNIEAGLNAAP